MRKTFLILITLFSVVLSLSAQESKKSYSDIPDATPNDEKSFSEWSLKIEKGSPRLNMVDGVWASPLHKALNSGYLGVAKTLVEKGSDFRTRDVNGSTCLHIAARNGHLEIVKILVEKGGEINGLDSMESSPLTQAAQHGHLEVVQYLLEKGAKFDLGRSPLLYCSSDKCLEVYKLLISKGADIHCKNDSPLLDASYEGYPEIIKLFLDAGANVNVHDNENFGATPLHQAALNGKMEAAKVLIERGADINAKNNNGKTPLFFATAKKNSEMVEFLNSKGAK